MDLSSLASLGKVAGIGGIAIGMIVLLVRPIIDGASSLPRAERGPTLRLIAIGAFGVGALGILAWLASGLTGGVSVTSGACGVASNGNGGNNSVNCLSVPAPGARP